MPESRIRTLFMGTPEFAVPPLRALLDSERYQVVGVVTQPDRPAGRGKQLQASPVKQAALAANVPVLQPEKLRAVGVFDQLAALTPDLIVVAAFGQILRQNVLDLPRFGCINVHASLLPRWRGAAPIQAAVRAGDAQTGITIMKMDAGLDTGPMLLKRTVPITREDTGETVHDKLAAIGGPLLIEALDGYIAGTFTPEAQPADPALSTYAPMLKKEDGVIDWSQSAAEIERQVRALEPWPGTATTWRGEPFKLLGGAAVEGSARPGEVVSQSGQIAVGTGAGGLFRLDRVQIAGKGPADVAAFARGHADFIGSKLG